MEITDKFVADVWNHLSVTIPDLTHLELEEALKCASGERECEYKKSKDYYSSLEYLKEL